LIIEHTVKGSKDASFHDFQISVLGMNLSLSSGSYFRGGQEIFKDIDSTVIAIPTLTDLIYYELWITTNGLLILTRKENEDFPYGQLTNQIDRICWFSVPANCTDLNNIDVHFVKVVE
jgi:hypothetical protein